MNELKKRYLTIPNIISLLRIILIYPFMKLFLQQDYVGSVLILLISGVSDMFDGMIARKFNQVTFLGQILDPIADKLTLIAVVACLVIKIPQIMPIAVLLIFKDVLMMLGGLFLMSKGVKPPRSKCYGKIATVVFYASILTIILLKVLFSLESIVASTVILSVTALFMLFALIKYFILFLNLLRK